MTAVGYDPATGTLRIMGVGDYPPTTLAAALDAQGFVRVSTLAGRTELYRAWADVTDLAGDVFATADALMAYLAGELIKRPATGSPQRNYAVSVTDGQTLFPISPAPVDVNTVVLAVNGVSYAPPDIAASSLAVTWRGPFTLAASDAVRVAYF